jgi:formylglycine-generating enzyme required for sulfatase activity
MGSPEHEIGRENNETLHTVTLTEDFWLADTACTQALWQAVMENNPSQSNQGDLYPVETVSWDNVDHFINLLNAELPDWNLRLPTEAEWEYACRAGSQSPFSFGENISTEQANYNGNHPYARGKQSHYREQTVEVTAFEHYNWGLYQMHGNVREWCFDWYADYSSEKLINPVGPTTSVARILRGGTWLNEAHFLRSASRFATLSYMRDHDIGFRLDGGRPSGA